MAIYIPASVKYTNVQFLKHDIKIHNEKHG